MPHSENPFVSRYVAALMIFGLTAAACGRSQPESRAAPAGIQLSGLVEEARDAAPYTYLRVRTAEGSVWTAVPLAPVQVGSQIRIANGVALKNFDAPGLSRRLDSVVFGVIQR